jgi:uncharacterized protein YhjY with autotransporter beta-barrel domain
MNTIGRAISCGPAPDSRGNGRVRLAWAIAALALFAGAVAPLHAFASAAIWASRCSGCHGASPALPQLNAAAARSVLDSAIANNAGLSMGAFKSTTVDATNGATPLIAADRDSLVAYIATVAGHNSQTVSVAYSGATTITLEDIATTTSPGASAVINALSTVTSPVRGSLGAYSAATPSVPYTHTATNCTQDSFAYHGTGLSGATTTNRNVTVNILAPAAPTATSTSPTIAYNTSALPVALNIGGGPALGLVVTSALSPAVGTLSIAGTSATYASSATIYAPTLTFSYLVDGPCANSAIANVTINVSAPPAPVVLHASTAGSPLIVPAGVSTPIDLASTISGVVASNPAGAYPLAASQPTVAGSGTTSVTGDVVTYNPGAFTGPTTFTYTKTGPGGVSNTETVFLNVTAAPIVSPTSVTTAFNTAIGVNLAAFIASSQPVTAVTPSSPVNGTALATGATTITFTPTPGFFGTGSFAYTATNAGGTSTAPATVTVTVNPPPPSVSPTAVTVPFNGGSPVVSTTIDLAPLIGPPGATVLSVTPSGATNGAVVATGPTTVSFTPTAGYTGPASFNYTATNAGGTSGSATVSLTVSPPAAPTAGPVNAIVSASAPTPIDLAPAITGFYTSVALASAPTAGSVTIAGAVATYTPQPGATGRHSFTYTATGPGGTSAPATVTVNYTDVPVATSFALVVPYQTATPVPLVRNVAGFVTSIAISTPPAHGTVTVNLPDVTYVPQAGYSGPDSFQFTATGPGGTSAPAVVSITVTPPPPTATDLQFTVPFQTATPIALPISGAFTDVTIVNLPAHGLVSTSPGSLTVVYTPANGFSGNDSFTFSAAGAGGASLVGTATITVTGAKPTAAAVTMTVAINSPTTLDLAPFIAGSGLTGVSISTAPAHGTIAVNGLKVTYTPRNNFFGTDTFAFMAFGDAGTSEPVTVTVTVVGRPDPSQDRNVVGLLEAQAQTARRFSRAQIGNYQRRMESLHAGPPASAPAEAGPKSPAPAARAPDNAPAGSARAAAFDPFASPPATTGFVPVSFTQAEARPKAAPAGFLQSALAGTLVSAATSRSIDVAGVTGTASAAATQGGTNLWLGGLAHFGKQGSADEGTDLRFSTDGLSMGADRRISDRLVLGLGIGYGRDETDFGTGGSRSKARGTSVAGYGSYQPTRNTFIDAVLGIGSLDIDSDRYVESMDEFATGRRKGRQFFGSVAAGYEIRRQGLLIAPYGRIDFTADKLDAATESGAGLNALAFREQTLRSTQAAAGLRLETRHETDFGWSVPRARVEYRREFEGGRTASLGYADQLGGQVYSVTPAGSSRNSILFGIGSDFLWKRGLKIGIDYQGERSSGPGTVQAVRFLLSQDLDGRLPAFPWSWSWKPFSDPVGVEAGFTFDDNVSRGRLAAEKITDQAYNFGLNASRTFPINDNTRAVATALLGVDKFHDHTGLGRTSGGLQGELQYRASGDFESITYTLFARAWIDGYESKLRSGSRLAAGVNARRSLTDRIDVFGEIGGNWRRAESAVFEGRDVAAKFNVDYSLGSAGTTYLAGEFRRGDTFSSGLASLSNLNSADVFTRDDAFDSGEIFAYRFEARTLIGTLGYNRPLGPRDSIDFSYRRVQTTPLTRPESGPSSYNVNQYSILYLMRF